MEFDDSRFGNAARELEKMYSIDLAADLRQNRSINTERDVGAFYQALNDLGVSANMAFVLYFLRQYIRDFRTEVKLAAADAAEIIERELTERYARQAGHNTTRLLTIIHVLCRQVKSDQPGVA